MVKDFQDKSPRHFATKEIKVQGGFETCQR